VEKKNKTLFIVIGVLLIVVIGIGCWNIGKNFSNNASNKNDTVPIEEEPKDNGSVVETIETKITNTGYSRKYTIGDEKTIEAENDTTKVIIAKTDDEYPFYEMSINGNKVLNDIDKGLNLHSIEFFHNYILIDYNIDIDDWSSHLAIYDINNNKIINDFATNKGYKEQILYYTGYTLNENSLNITFEECGDQCGLYLIQDDDEENWCSNIEKYKNVIQLKKVYELSYSNDKFNESKVKNIVYLKDLTKEEVIEFGRLDDILSCYDN
jgi:hypothetical protein